MVPHSLAFSSLGLCSFCYYAGYLLVPDIISIWWRLNGRYDSMILLLSSLLTNKDIFSVPNLLSYGFNLSLSFLCILQVNRPWNIKD